MTLEAISVPTFLASRRYMGGMLLGTGTHWQRCEEVALGAACEARAAIEKVSIALGRSETSVAHRASDTGLIIPREWRDLITRRRLSQATPKRDPLQYPYIVESKGEHADLLAVNSLVPRGLPDHVRADVCQEIMLALWEGGIALEELQASPALVRKFIKRFNADNHEMGGYALSLDSPMQDGRSWYDVLPDPNTMDYAA